MVIHAGIYLSPFAWLIGLQRCRVRFRATFC